MNERTLAELEPARRNRYYYGKMMDVLHCSMEQQYGLAKQWLYNRAVLGPGAVCGLDVEAVTTDAGSGIVIRSGLAFDGWGRGVIVPHDVVLVPLVLTDECGAPQPPEEEPLPSEVVVKLCYSECLTDWTPAMVNDADCGCGGECSCEAGTVIETYCITVLAGHAPPVEEPCNAAVLKAIKAGELHAVMCELSRVCAPDPDDPCLTLANVSIDGGTLTVDSISPRPIAPTNRMLMQVISCLAECCAGHDDPPPPPHPTTFGPRVASVRVMSARQQDPNDPQLTTLAQLEAGQATITVRADELPDIVEVTLDRAYDPATVVLNDSFHVTPELKVDELIKMPNNMNVRLYRKTGFKAGVHNFLLVGEPGPGDSPQAIRATDGTRLDGKRAGGTGGSNFRFALTVEK